MNLAKDHKKSTLFLILYFSWWIYFAYSFFINNDASRGYLQNNASLLIISFSIMLIYWLILLFMVLMSKAEKQADFLLFFALVSTPLVITLFYVLTES